MHNNILSVMSIIMNLRKSRKKFFLKKEIITILFTWMVNIIYYEVLRELLNSPRKL